MRAREWTKLAAMKRWWIAALLAASVLFVTRACRTTAPALPASERPQTWAQPVEVAGVDNVHRVSDTLWRGAQPTARGFAELERLGVRTVLTLRAFHDDDLPAGSKLATERIWVKTWHAEDEDVVRFLRIVSDPAKQPVFVHCHWGADRTGMMCAVYRIVLCGWSKDEAIDEMLHGDFDFHEHWQNLVEYIRDLDVERIAREAGLRDAPVAR